MITLFKYVLYGLILTSCFNFYVIASSQNLKSTEAIIPNNTLTKEPNQTIKTQESLPENRSIESHLLTLHKHYQNKLFQAKGFPIVIKHLEKTSEGVLININYAPNFSKEALPYLEEKLKKTLEASLILFETEKPLFLISFNEDDTLKTIWEN